MRAVLRDHIRQMRKQRDWLAHSYARSKAIGIQDVYSDEELETFELLTGRYARGIDFLIRKLFRSIDAYEFENQGTLIDTVNNAHKRGLVEEIETLRLMKDIRNTIAHEYIEEQLQEVFDEVLEYTPFLLEMMDRTLAYAEKATGSTQEDGT
jgi:uncharacterized protein YutE (UPF0331/DUF86 family)